MKAEVEVAARSLEVGMVFGRCWEVPDHNDLSELKETDEV
jgi:hypothetical protein